MSQHFTDDHRSTASTFHRGDARSRDPSPLPPGSSWLERVQLALAVMGGRQLSQFLLDGDPGLALAHRLGQVCLKLQTPIGEGAIADGCLEFEVISCRLADPDTVPPFVSMTSRFQRHRALVNQIRCETKLQNLGVNLTLTDAIARLQCALFSSHDIQRILNLPYHGWHRSWWEMVDPAHEFSLPFQRLMRSRRYDDGRITVQYKDQFAHLPPPCFRSHRETALVQIQRPHLAFAPTLAQINRGRHALGTPHAVLIYQHLSAAEYHGFRHQGVSLYQWEGDRAFALVPSALPGTSVNCQHCGQYHCPLQGHSNSPVIACQRFQPPESNRG